MASFLSEIETAITAQLTTIGGTAVGLTTAAQPAFVTGLVVWIVLIGYEVAFGKSQDAISYVFTKIGKISLIGWVALWGWPDIAQLLNALKDSALGTGGSAASAIETAVLNPLANTWSSMSIWFMDTVESMNFYQLLTFLSVWVAYMFMVAGFLILALLAGTMAAVSFGMFMIAQVVFGLLMVIGPFFLLCLMFPFTQKFFEAYIGNVMTSVFALALTSIVLNLGANVLGLDTALGLVTAPAADVNAFMEFAKSIAVLFLAKAGAAALLIYMFLKVWDLAAALGGGLNMGNNMIGGVRNLLSEANSQSKSSGGGKTNSISSGGGPSYGAASSRAQAANSMAGGSSFSGTAARGISAASGAVASGALGIANSAARAGAFAYNRYGLNNRINANF